MKDFFEKKYYRVILIMAYVLLLMPELYAIFYAVPASDDFAMALLDKALVALVPCSGFGIKNFVRWSYAASMENIEKGLDRLEKFVTE